MMRMDKNKVVKRWGEMIGATIETDELGLVKIIDFEEHEGWGGKVNIYIDEFNMDTCVGTIPPMVSVVGGGLLVEKV